MNTVDLRERLAAILEEEEREVVDWTTVDEMLDRLNDGLKGSSPECPHFVRHFIADGTYEPRMPLTGPTNGLK